MEAIMSQFQGHESAHFQVDSVKRTLDALIAIANYLAHFPGRKNLIWVSSSFPISIGFDTERQPGDTRDQIHFTSDLEHAYKHSQCSAQQRQHGHLSRGCARAVCGGARHDELE